MLLRRIGKGTDIMGNIAYRLHDRLYLNLTNKCPCSCSFCIRKNGSNVGTADNLWLKEEPDYETVLADLAVAKVKEGEEITFCGYGEPVCALDMLLRVAEFLKSRYHAKLRLNTNGLGNQIHGRDIVPELAGLIDSVSISLNASDAEKYQAIVHSSYGTASYGEMLRFASSCKAAGINTQFTVVDVIGPEEVEACRKVAANLGIKLRVREYISDNNAY